MKSEIKTCQNCKLEFVIEPDDFLFYEKIKVPAPTFCPECRLQRRVSLRNERAFYHRNCDLCKEKIISVFNDKNLKVYCQGCWASDQWDSSSYAVDYDFSKNFFAQYIELFKKIPLINLNGHISNKNSPYVNYITEANNSYYCFGGSYLENVMFSNLGVRIKDSMEILFSEDCQFCYEILNCSRCYRLFYGNNSQDCLDSYFLQDCGNCHDCIMSCNLKNQYYVFKNEQLSKEEYLIKKEEFLKQLNNDVSKRKKEFAEHIIAYPKKFANILRSQSSTGNNILECADVKSGFNVSKCQNGKYNQDVVGSAKDVYDVTSIGLNVEMIYESTGMSKNINNILFSSLVRDSSFNVSYSFHCHGSSNLFGCIGLRKKQYCILNRQYTKEAYEELIPKIIQHMSDMPYIDSKGRVYKYGEFFPSELSPFAYNETIAQEYFPLTKEEAIEQGYKWKDKEERNYSIDIHTEDLPDSIKEIPDTDILNKVIECNHKGTCNQQCTEAFKIIPEELSFYRRMNLLLPRLCPNCRHYERLSQRNPMKLWHRSCMKEGCTNEFETSYAPERPEIVYCEKCYQQEVY
ncbi:MAG: hypothetical protein NTV03_01770 [Candidatus Nomurabacteria bacterium]|nr:hypothetical protein [Candidatus Nomurabacteria bacterium]